VFHFFPFEAKSIWSHHPSLIVLTTFLYPSYLLSGNKNTCRWYPFIKRQAILGERVASSARISSRFSNPIPQACSAIITDYTAHFNTNALGFQ